MSDRNEAYSSLNGRYTEPTPKEPPILSTGYRKVRGNVDCDLDKLGPWLRETFTGHWPLVILVASAVVCLSAAAVVAALGAML